MSPARPPIIEAEDVWFDYADRSPVLRGVTLSTPAGAWMALLGCNGSGKSTLVKHFNGLLRAQRGRVLLEGVEIRRQSVGELARHVAYLPQNPDRMIFADSVRGEIAFGPAQQGLSGPALDERVEQAMELLGLSHVARMPPATLGYGLRRKVALASVLALRPRLLILDEPTNGLDAGCAAHFMEIVENLHREGLTIVMITHDLKLAARHAQRVALMQDGQIVAIGDTRDILSNTEQLTAAGLMPLPVTQLAACLKTDLLPRLATDMLTPQEFARSLLATIGTVANGETSS
jgi:energy-coupling factor transporter ATP-binding protein EcfA2